MTGCIFHHAVCFRNPFLFQPSAWLGKSTYLDSSCTKWLCATQEHRVNFSKINEEEKGYFKFKNNKTMTDASEVLTTSIIREMSHLMMEAVSTSETLVNIYQTTLHNIPDDSHPHTHGGNLKSNLMKIIVPCQH
jgi:hypothetical protein